jgi:hypothetical protein
MSDPLPMRLDPAERSACIDAAWERAVRDRLADHYHRAGRPRLGPVSDDANAVVFADEAELLACLARDIVGGKLHERWWWHDFIARLPLTRSCSLTTVLCEGAAALPGALALLAKEDRAADIVRALTPEEALTVLSTVGVPYGVPDFAANLVSTAAAASLQRAATSDGSESGGSAPSARVGALQDTQPVASLPRARETPPWLEWVPRHAVPADLDFAQACLLGVALVLHRRPEVARSAAFAAALRLWWRSMSTPMRPGRASPSGHQSGASAARSPDAPSDKRQTQLVRDVHALPPPSIVAPSRHAATTPARPSASTPEDSEKTDAPSDAMPETRPAAGSPAAPPRDRPIEREIALASPLAPPQSPFPFTDATPSSPAAAPAKVDLAPVAVSDGPQFLSAITVMPSPTSEDRAERDLGLALECGIETALGGLFFLINLMCALDLPATFEEEWHLASGVGAWGVLGALGRGLLMSEVDAINDPIWAALALLSGDRPGARLAAGANYRLPEAWLAAVPAEGRVPVAWAARRGWLRVWSNTGYVLSETELGGMAPATAARHEAERYGDARTPSRAAFAAAPLPSLAGPLAAVLDRRLKRWLTLVISFIRLRLTLALGMAADDKSLSRAVLARRGRLFVTRTHVDLVMGLDSVTLPVRLAGLDRSPGWLPAFSRVVLFHYE